MGGRLPLDDGIRRNSVSFQPLSLVEATLRTVSKTELVCGASWCRKGGFAAIKLRVKRK